MPIGGMGASQFRGTVVQAGVYSVTATIPVVTTGASGSVVGVSLPGVQVGDVLLIAPVAAPALAGVAFAAEVSAANTATITVINGNAGSTTSAATLFTVVALRPKTA